jgi:hypothetical protein
MTPAADAYLTYLNFQCNQKLPERSFSLLNCLKCQHKGAACPENKKNSVISIQQNTDKTNQLTKLWSGECFVRFLLTQWPGDLAAVIKKPWESPGFYLAQLKLTEFLVWLLLPLQV